MGLGRGGKEWAGGQLKPASARSFEVTPGHAGGLTKHLLSCNSSGLLGPSYPPAVPSAPPSSQAPTSPQLDTHQHPTSAG